MSLLIIETSFAEPLPRVGDTIDVAERNYFQLFPTITEFSEAIVTRNEGGDGIAIRSRNPRQDVKIRLDSAEHAELSHYLNDYEEIGFGKQKVDRARLSDFIWYKPQPQRKGAMINVGKSSGELTRVKLFHFADSSITVFYPHIVPDWNDPYTFSVFPADEIEFISTCETNQFRAASIGFLAGVGVFTIFAIRERMSEDITSFIAVPLFGVLSGLSGAFVGLAVSELDKEKNFTVNGSGANLARYRVQMERRARSPYLPPELVSQKPGQPK